jgi:hypothetical protein
MRMLNWRAPVAALLLLTGVAAAADFRLEETASIPAAVDQLKPQTIVFADLPGEELLDATTGFMRYEDWARVRPIERQFLTLYPTYTEPNIEVIVDGAKKRYREKLHMYVAQSRFLVARPAASIDIAGLAKLPFIQRLDPAIQHRLLTAEEAAARPKEPKSLVNQNPQRRWCEGRATAICLRSTYKLEGRLPAGIQLANKIREGSRKISDTLEFDSEVAALSASEAADAGLAKLTRLDTPVAGALEESIFYVNEVLQFGKLVAVFQPHPADANKTVVTVFVALAIDSGTLGKRKQFAQVPVLRNLVPAQVLSGKSSFNSGSSLSAGLPVYARNQVKAIANVLNGG